LVAVVQPQHHQRQLQVVADLHLIMKAQMVAPVVEAKKTLAEETPQVAQAVVDIDKIQPLPEALQELSASLQMCNLQTMVGLQEMIMEAVEAVVAVLAEMQQRQ
jgi:transketolase C-terminal domain/subunit